MYSIARFRGKRYIGDLRSKEKIVHDFAFQKESVLRDCNLRELTTEHLQLFDPDTLDQAKKQGFHPCPHCLFPQQ